MNAVKTDNGLLVLELVSLLEEQFCIFVRGIKTK